MRALEVQGPGRVTRDAELVLGRAVDAPERDDAVRDVGAGGVGGAHAVEPTGDDGEPAGVDAPPQLTRLERVAGREPVGRPARSRPSPEPPCPPIRRRASRGRRRPPPLGRADGSGGRWSERRSAPPTCRPRSGSGSPGSASHATAEGAALDGFGASERPHRGHSLSIASARACGPRTRLNAAAARSRLARRRRGRFRHHPHRHPHSVVRQDLGRGA